MRIVLFGNQGHGTTALREILKHASVTGVVSKPRKKRKTRIKAAIYRAISQFEDPFYAYTHPSMMGANYIPSGKMDSVLDLPKPDLIIACSFHRLIPKQITDLAPAVNIHPGLLPQRGGGTPNRWAIYKGDEYTGVSAHLMTNEFDAGDLIWQKKLGINKGELWGDLETRLDPLVQETVAYVLKTPPEQWKRIPQTPEMQPPFKQMASDELIDRGGVVCRATLPKFCGVGRCRFFRECRL